MIKKLKTIFTACLLFVFIGDAQAGKKNLETKTMEPRKISAKEAKKILEENPHAVLVDVRTPEEFRGKRIPGALLLPVDEVKKRAPEVLPRKEALLLVYCRRGIRSAKAARALAAMGYTNIYDLGGIESWPYATVGASRL